MKTILDTLKRKWAEYLLEILVLTIGIYGAFALNNWNEYKKAREEEQILYNQLLLDYEANLKQLNEKISLHEIIIDAGFSLLNDFDNTGTAIYDSVIADLSIIGIDPTFDPIINDLNGSGKINLIRNPALNRLLSNWSSDITSLRELQLAWSMIDYTEFHNRRNELGINRDISSVFWELQSVNNQWLLGKKTTITRKVSRSKQTPNLTIILSDKVLEGIVADGVIFSQSSLSQALVLKERIEEIISLIKSEIK